MKRGRRQYVEGTKSLDAKEEITASLLLYRIMLVFGIHIGPSEEGDKIAWKLRLQYRHDSDQSQWGVLEFQDTKGCWEVFCGGTKQARDSALELLEWILGNNIAHPYCQTLAGCVA
jgi:hypothetical protein